MTVSIPPEDSITGGGGLGLLFANMMEASVDGFPVPAEFMAETR
ncbi:MAG TPA: hypothetical protein VKB83_03805 [Nitrosopumilaceae archaeon]|nr:hypothetical protein [Nitrosopumilaceae archaeon]